MIRIDALWLCAQPVDMRAGADRLLASVVAALGEAHAHHGYLFANARATRIKLLVHDGFGIWCSARRLHAGRFVWTSPSGTPALALTREQFDALVVGLPWQRLPGKRITDHQVHQYKQDRNRFTQVAAADRAGASECSARRIEQGQTLPRLPKTFIPVPGADPLARRECECVALALWLPWLGCTSEVSVFAFSKRRHYAAWSVIVSTLIRMLVAIFAVLLAPAAAHAQAYDSGTVPDEQGRQALLNRASDIGRDNISIHSKFPQIIEQNFAAMRPAKAAAVIDNLTDIELSNLKQFYGAANFDANRESRLLPILAYRLNAKRLARIARHFGYAETYAAVSGYSPEKLASFSVAYANEPAPAAVAQGGGIGRFLGFTPHEIYLDFRTAPVGSLGVTGALYETAAVLGSAISVSYGAGYTAGSAAAYLIQTYSPSTWDAIGGTVAGMVDNMTQAYDLATLGYIQESLGAVFGLSSYVRDQQINNGGDYGCSTAWQRNYPYGTPEECADDYSPLCPGR